MKYILILALFYTPNQGGGQRPEELALSHIEFDSKKACDFAMVELNKGMKPQWEWIKIICVPKGME